MTDKKSVTFGLLWHSTNSDNLGIGALTAGHIAILEELAAEMGLAPRFKVLGWKDPEPAYISAPNVETVGMRARDLFRPSGLFSALRDCDLLLDISAGDSFADIYGTRRFVLNIVSKINVLVSGRTLILSPQTVGPFKRWWARVLAVMTMSGARHVVTRDSMSSDYVRELGLSRKLVEATDVAFRLPYDLPPPRDHGPVRVGLNISGLLFNGGYSRKNMFDLAFDYAEFARALCKAFVSNPDCELHLIGHVNSHGQEVEDDYRVTQKLAEEFPGAIVAPRFAGPSAAKSYIAELDFFAGSRMHACIAAFSSGVPVMPVAYSRKFEGLFGTLGYNRLVDAKKHTADEAIAAVMDAFNQRDTLKTEVAAAFDRAQVRLATYQGLIKSELERQARL